MIHADSVVPASASTLLVSPDTPLSVVSVPRLLWRRNGREEGWGRGIYTSRVLSVSGREGGSRMYRRRLIREIREWEFVYLLDCFHLFGLFV